MSAHDPLAAVPAELIPRLAEARLVALDVDGVLTDGSVIRVAGQEAQCFNVKDGAGLVWLVRAGLSVVWITGRGCEATRLRAAELGASLHAGVGEKGAVLARVQREAGIEPAATVAMGDDLPDLALAAGAGVFVVPSDAAPDVRARADWVTSARGGHGAVRELCEALLAARGSWSDLVDGAGG
jgi:3-deoxy-D-manno-octulosonate 8-phosphate phosphatase (KDO 8-P phosphatase)